MKQITFLVDDQLAEKFEIALKLTGDNGDAVAADFIRSYLGTAFSRAAEDFGASAPAQEQKRPFGPTHATAPRRNGTPPPPPVYRTPDQQPQERPGIFSEWGKAIHRIPRWASNTQQNNHKILKAFLELQQELGRVTLDALRKRCSDPIGHPETFVPHFDNNYAQMKFDNGNSHGKVFEEDAGYVTIWDRISDTLLRYRDYFL